MGGGDASLFMIDAMGEALPPNVPFIDTRSFLDP